MRSVGTSAALVLLVLAGSASGQGRHQRHSLSHTSKHAGKSPSQLKQELNTARIQREKLEHQLGQTRREKRVVAKDIHVVDARLERLEDELDRTTHRLNDNQSEAKQLAIRLDEATKRMKEVKAEVARRLADMYMRRHSSYLSALAGTRSMNDLLTRQQILEAITKYDHDLFVEYRNLHAEIGTKKRRQDQLVNQIRDLKSSQVLQQSSLKTTRSEKGEMLQSLQAKAEDLNRQIRQWDADEEAIQAEIEAYARRAIRPGSKPLPQQFIGKFLKPANGPITSGFGSRYHPILHYTRPHKGIDIGASYGSPIWAAADGVVIAAKYSTSFGNMIIIAHGGNLSTVYAHCSRLYVSAGQSVKRGQRIGAVGATGLAKGPHLHWEVHVGGTAVNPMGRF